MIGTPKVMGNILLHRLHIPWCVGMPYEEIFGSVHDEAQKILSIHESLTLVGASAGASLALNIFHNLKREDVPHSLTAVSLSGWLRVAQDGAEGGVGHLRRVALTESKAGPSQACVKSILNCSLKSVPDLSEADKKRLAICMPFSDEVVPRNCMQIDGIVPFIIPEVSGHVKGIIQGRKLLPYVVSELQS